jgi:hypothetical protein
LPPDARLKQKSFQPYDKKGPFLRSPSGSLIPINPLGFEQFYRQDSFGIELASYCRKSFFAHVFRRGGNMNKPSDPKEKRQYPRVLINMPLNFKMTEGSNQSAGLVINASEAGLLIQTFKDMPIGKRIIIEVSSPKRTRPVQFSAMTEIIWKDLYIWDDWEAYQYGLKFSHISYEDYLKLKQILGSQSNLQEVTLSDESNRKQRLIIKTK